MARGTRGLDPFSLDDMAILVRAAHQMRAFEDRFLTIGLPYRVIGGPRFYERLEIRDAMAYFRLVVSPDDDLAFERIVNTPKRGLGDKAQQTIQVMARSNGVSLVEGARLCVRTKTIGGKGGKALGELVDGLARWRAELLDGRDHIHLAEEILDESGYTGFWQNEKTPEAPGRLENLKELVKALEGFENLQGFLEHVSLIMDTEQGQDEPMITLMTLHARQGAGVSGGVPARLGRRPVPVAALDGRERGQGSRGGAAARLRGHHPRRAGRHDQLRRQSPRLRPVAIGPAVAVHRRVARGARRGADAARPVRRRLRSERHGGGAARGDGRRRGIRHAGEGRQGRRLQLPRLAAPAGQFRAGRCGSRRRPATS